MNESPKKVYLNIILSVIKNHCKTVAQMLPSHSPRPPAPRKIPPTASASQSRDTPIIMQPATMLSRAEPTRSPWYPPTLTGFIQQVESPTCLLRTRQMGASGRSQPHSLPTFHSLLHAALSSGEAPHLYFLFPRTSHVSLKRRSGFYHWRLESLRSWLAWLTSRTNLIGFLLQHQVSWFTKWDPGV